MNLLPPPGPGRTRLVVLIVLLGVAAVGAYYMNYGGAAQPAPTAPPRTASNLPGPIAEATSPIKPGPQKPTTSASAPEPLKLPDLERVPDEPVPGRNPFKFGVKYVAPTPTPTPIFTPTLPPTPTPPPPPQVPLTLTGVMLLEPQQRNRAFLTDKHGGFHQAVAGQIIDGQYRVVAVGTSDAVVEFVDGSGRRTLRVGVK